VVGVLKLGDQVMGKQATNGGGFGTAAQVGRQWFNVAIRTSGSGFEDGGLGDCMASLRVLQ